MGWKLQKTALGEVLNSLEMEYRVFGPVCLPGIGTFSEQDILRYGEIKEISELVHDEKTDYSQKEVYFPITETLFHFVNGEVIETKEQDDRGIILFLRACDLNSLKSLDHIFLKNGSMEDPYYQRLRKKLKFFLLECREGFESCFCVSMDANRTNRHDAAFRFHGEEVLVELNTNTGDEFGALLEKTFKEKGEEIEFQVEFVEKNKHQVKLPETEQVTMDMFDSEIWTEYTKRCIACGRCNFVCPTCTCWTMQDAMFDQKGQNGERRRVWGSCHVDGYTDMAGGHSFRRTNGERMRFKVFHKVYDFKKRFGEHMCVGCGRCDDICPEYISYRKSIDKLATLAENEKKKKEAK